MIRDLKLSSKELSISGGKLDVSVNIQNTGNYDGEEVVQLYIRDLVGCVVRPVKELKGFQKVFLKKGETKSINFSITPNELKFYNDQVKSINEPGDYEIFVGNSSDATLKESFVLTL